MGGSRSGLRVGLCGRTLSKTGIVGIRWERVGIWARRWFHSAAGGTVYDLNDKMLRLTKKADYGLMALKYLAEQTASAQGSVVSAHSAKDIAEAYHIPPQLLAKILQTLAKAGLLVSHAGTNGGYALAKAATEISAFEVIRAIDGPLFITSCITIHGACDLTSTCTIKEPLRKVNDSIKDLLSGLHIADLIEADGEQAGTGAPVGGGLVTIAV